MTKSTTTFMGLIEKRAKSIVAPNKYSKVLDWKRHSHASLGQMPKARKVTMTTEVIEFQRRYNKPGPDTYQQWIKPKTKGFYKFSDQRYGIVSSIAYDKKGIPAPNLYKGRGKDMFETMQTGPSTIQYGKLNEAAKANDRMEKIKKDGKPGP